MRGAHGLSNGGEVTSGHSTKQCKGYGGRPSQQGSHHLKAFNARLHFAPHHRTTLFAESLSTSDVVAKVFHTVLYVRRQRRIARDIVPRFYITPDLVAYFTEHDQIVSSGVCMGWINIEIL